MKNPFKQFGTALKIGYNVLQKYEALEQAGLVPQLKIKNVPVSVIDNAAKNFATTLLAHHHEDPNAK